MSMLTFPNLSQLVPDMQLKNVEKERFQFHYANHEIDCVFATSNNNYELITAIHNINFGFVVKIHKNTAGLFIAEINDEIYNNFCSALSLSYSVNHFTSNALLTLLSNNIPTVSNGITIPYQELRQFISYRHVDESDKIYFCGWNDHIQDGRTARNFDKTEFFLGSEIANYCRTHNISSLWTDIMRDEKPVTKPWN